MYKHIRQNSLLDGDRIALVRAGCCLREGCCLACCLAPAGTCKRRAALHVHGITVPAASWSPRTGANSEARLPVPALTAGRPPSLHAVQATISQESAAEEAPAASLSMPPLGVGEAEGGDEGPEVRSVDEVLADVDAALAAAEEALARGRSPSSAAWASTARPGGGSSSSTASGGPDMRGPAAAAARLAPPAAGS